MDKVDTFYDMREDTEIVERLGYEWRVCHQSGNLDQYITILTEQGDRLILMQKESFITKVSGGFRFVPAERFEFSKEHAFYG